jgi:hypothetical protein
MKKAWTTIGLGSNIRSKFPADYPCQSGCFKKIPKGEIKKAHYRILDNPEN